MKSADSATMLKSVFLAIGLILSSVTLAGCVNRIPPTVEQHAAMDYSKPSPVSKSWLPIHEQDQRIIAVGGYHLPKAIVIPPGIKHLPLALTDVWNVSHRLASVQIYFPASEEQKIYEWAQSIPFVVSHTGEFRWERTYHYFYKQVPADPPGMVLLTEKPVTAPYAWWFAGVAVGQYRGYSEMWLGDPPPSALELNRAAQGIQPLSVKYADDFNSGSPVRNVKRRIMLNVRYPIDVGHGK